MAAAGQFGRTKTEMIRFSTKKYLTNGLTKTTALQKQHNGKKNTQRFLAKICDLPQALP